MKCNFCERTFTQPKRFASHMCETKRRFIEKDSRAGQMAYELFQRFQKFHRIRQTKKDPLMTFLNSRHYRAFKTLAEFFLQTKPLDTNEYFEYLMQSNTPFRKWTSEDFYSEWVRGKIMMEDADSAVARSIETLLEFASERGISLNEVYHHLTGNRLSLWLRTGRISPWFIVLSKDPTILLDKLEPEMLSSLEDIINPLFWRMRYQKSIDAGRIHSELQKADL